ncbi:hypothetical protein E2C01_007873 [Portunus trituberculatus]|uniref:Uncharacterized protein n=1 Tax=Portunus trituberculatus TaxID=210409 RepID=A0A5B7D055_PORTR|nr:hypothetical protein [Portunus trituberculatus]
MSGALRSINQEAYWKLEVVPVCNQPRRTGRIHGARYRETDTPTDPFGFYTGFFGASLIYIFPAPGSHSGQEAASRDLNCTHKRRARGTSS